MGGAQCAQMALTRPGLGRVEAIEIEKPEPGPSEVLVKVLACGVCRTDLHVIDGDLELAIWELTYDT